MNYRNSNWQFEKGMEFLKKRWLTWLSDFPATLIPKRLGPNEIVREVKHENEDLYKSLPAQ